MAKLSHHDAHSSAWLHVKKYVEDRIERQRIELEKTSKGHDETMVTRGQIKALRFLLKEMEQGSAED